MSSTRKGVEHEKESIVLRKSSRVGGAQKCEMDLYVSLNQEDFDTYF